MQPCLIIRSLPGAQQTAVRVKDLGLEPITMPAARVLPTGAVIDVNGVQALLMTSAAAARNALVDSATKALPVYAVGDATAEAAIEAGFTSVVSAGGDASTLAVLAADRLKPGDGALLHLRGGEIAGDVAAMLVACGFEARAIEVYRSEDHPDFSTRLAAALAGVTGFILLHSPAGARRFAHAVRAAHHDLSGWSAIGLSAACLKPLTTFSLKSRVIADRPDEPSLMEALANCL